MTQDRTGHGRRYLTLELQVGQVGTARTVVSRTDLAAVIGSGAVEVYGTPALIALLEMAAVNAVDHLLPDGTVSVGTHLDVRHLAPTPQGVEVHARAELVEVSGRRFTFHVEAFDPTEKIGEGTHQRVAVAASKLVGRAMAKLP